MLAKEGGKKNQFHLAKMESPVPGNGLHVNIGCWSEQIGTGKADIKGPEYPSTSSAV